MAEKNPPSPSPVLRFGVFQVNLAARELRKHGVRIRLPGQPFCILSILLEKPGEVITREEIRRRLWSSDTFVDFEHSLNSAIKKLRAALGDSPENSRYIETVPRVGYRFIAPVEQVSLTATTVAGASAVMDRSGVPAAAVDVSGKRRERMLLEFAIVLVVVPSAYLAWSRFRSRSQPQVKIASEIRNASNGHESARSNGQPVLSPKSAEAQELYRKGMYFWSKRTVGGFQQAIEYFQQATTIDPNYALAYAGLANSYTLLTGYSSASSTLYMPQARAAALRALELDERLAEAHTALALIVQNYDWDWQTAGKEYRRAIQLNPNYATAHHWYAEHLAFLGRFDEALREGERASQLDPLSLIIAADQGVILYYSRQYDRAIEQFRAVLDMDPGFSRAGVMTQAYVEKGLFKDALAFIESRRRLADDGPWTWATLAYVYGRAGQPVQARRALVKLEELGRHQQLDPGPFLAAYIGMGDKELAFAWLEKAYLQHSNVLAARKVEPCFHFL